MNDRRIAMMPSNNSHQHRRRVIARCLAGAAAALALTTGAFPAPAQDYPTRPVKIIVPFPAGGTADAMPRVVADWLSRKWQQPVVIENRSGVGGNVGAEAAYKSDPDGYTLLSAPAPPLVINQNLYPKLGFDPLKFERIAVMGRVPNALLTNPDFPPKTVAELIAYAKANPGKVISATQGNGTTSHLTSEMFQMLARVQVTHVPYRGAAPAINDLVGGTANIMFDNLGVSLGQVRGGKLRLLAVATPKRMTSLPDVPTMAETLPGFESAAWFAVVAPPQTPKQIVTKINADIGEALRSPEVIERMNNFSAEIVGGSLQETDKYMTEEVERWLKVIKAANVKLE
jgi:tripartite-type tricarboxylate transporter receptor subunit TctC